MAVVKSRNIIKNWLTASILYLLGRDRIRVRCLSGEAYLPRDIYGRVVRGYFQGFIYQFDCNGNEFLINGQKIRINRLGNCFDLFIAKFKRELPSIKEIFITRVYEKLNVAGRVVVDVGAFVGDSAIYFAVRGAEKVIAIEPHPGAYQEMLENIRLNNMEDKIIPINAGLASRTGWIKISRVDVDSTATTLYKIDNFGNVMTVTLGEIINKYSIPNNAVLKMDCEGCEYDVILNDYEHVKLFGEVILEYHGNLMPLLNTMKRDYDCSVFDKILYCRRRL
ncbi:FkbM family methyltransferase [Thermogladius calderae]|uniref:FkbM family methyltransferase n=1 Tax=Thermogladius calderae TaxID=1200300 RepID=UPI0006947B0C|nr:FkbM family methyltransferase [Thermogladius calderae]